MTVVNLKVDGGNLNILFDNFYILFIKSCINFVKTNSQIFKRQIYKEIYKNSNHDHTMCVSD